MQATLGGLPLAEPKTTYESCLRLRLPADWYGLPNNYTDRAGVDSGVGWALMLRRHLLALDLDAEHDLVFAQRTEGYEDRRRSVTYKHLHVVNARCVTPGLRGDPDAAYLLELADRRRRAGAVVVDLAYNVRSAPGSSSYFSSTLNGGSAWTWSGMVGSIWAAVGTGFLGAFPGLPSAPDGAPDGWRFHGWYGMQALGVVLDRLSMALAYRRETGAFAIVQTGATDGSAAALSAHDRLRILDAEYVEPDASRYPHSAVVLFPTHRQTPDSTGGTPWYAVTVPLGAAGAVSGTEVRITDDLPALYDSSGTLTNSAALSTRAAERAANFLAQLRVGLSDRTFSGLLADANLDPGARLRATRRGDRGAGAVTQLLSLPGGPVSNPDGSGFWGAGRGPDGSPLGSGYGGGGGAGGGGGGPSGSPPAPQSGLSSSATSCPCDAPYSVLQLYQSNYPSSTFQTWTVPQTATLTGTQQNNFTVNDGTTSILFTTNSNTTLTGLTGGRPGRPILLTNDGTATLTLTDGSGSSSVGNRLDTPGGIDYPVPPGKSAWLVWSDTTSTWVVQNQTTVIPYRPTSITGTYNNFTIPTGATSFVPTLTGTATVTGFADVPPYSTLWVTNPLSNSDTLTLSHLSGSSSSGNQMSFSTGSDLTLSPGESIALYNDGSKLVDLGGSLSLPPGGSSGAGTLLGTFTAANAATLDCTGLGGYRIVKVYGYSFQTKNALLTNLLLRTSANNGSSYDAGGSDYNSGAGTAAQITISVALPPDSTAANALSFEVTIYEADVSGASRYKVVQWNSSAYNSGLTNSTGSGARLSDGVINAVRLLGTTANLNGTVKAYGYN